MLTELYLEWLQENQANTADVDQAAAPDREAAGVGIQQIRATYCLRESIAAAEPDVPPGGTGDLRATAGVIFGSEPTAFGAFMQVGFQPDPPGFTGYETEPANAQGEAFFPVTADPNGTIRYRVCAYFVGDFRDAGLITAVYRPDGINCRSSVTGVVVTPSQVSIAPNASQQFTAVVEGTSNQAVTWSVDGGGAITQTGLFTSNGTEGTFFVRATSEEDPNSVGVAQVTVGTPPPPPPPGELPCIAAACTFSGTWIRCETRNDGNIVCVEVTTIFSNPQARVFPQPGQPTRVSVSFSCGQTGSLSSLGGTIQPTGAFTVSQLVGSNPCLLGTATGMLTASSLQFTLVDGFDPRRVFSFSGSR